MPFTVSGVHSTGVQVASHLTFRSVRGLSANERWLELLAQLGQRGSIVAAARSVGLSYKAAWDAIETMNNLADAPLVTRAVGGRGGGGTRLTASGERLVRTFRAVKEQQSAFIDRINRHLDDPEPQLRVLGRFGIRSSARNQFAGKVARIRRGAVNDEVELALRGGQPLVALITHQSTRALGLKLGSPAIAWIKASWLIIMAGDASAVRCSARNRLGGTISRVTRGAVNTEVVLELAGGQTLAATVTNVSARALGLRRGVAATALCKASSVILVTSE